MAATSYQEQQQLAKAMHQILAQANAFADAQKRFAQLEEQRQALSEARCYNTHMVFDPATQNVWRLRYDARTNSRSIEPAKFDEAMWHVSANPGLYGVESSSAKDATAQVLRLSDAFQSLAGPAREKAKQTLNDSEFDVFREQNASSLALVNAYFNSNDDASGQQSAAPHDNN